mgnify:CR=1 FL=1
MLGKRPNEGRQVSRYPFGLLPEDEVAGIGVDEHSCAGDGPDEPEDERTMRHLARQRRRYRRRNLRRFLLTVGLLLVIAIAGLAWVGMDALSARGELKAAATQVHVLQGQVEKGDRKGAKVTLTSLQAHAAAAQAKTHGR